MLLDSCLFCCLGPLQQHEEEQRRREQPAGQAEHQAGQSGSRHGHRHQLTDTQGEGHPAQQAQLWLHRTG